MPQTQNWWMFHGDPAHTGEVAAGSDLNSQNVNSKTFKTLFTLQLDGPVLSVPAVVNGFVYVGIANSQEAQGSNGGTFYKIDVTTGTITGTFTWVIDPAEGDTHGFMGMGCTPAIVNGMVYFSAFDGKLYCLDADTLTLAWVTNLRYADLDHNQPITNTRGMEAGYPPVAGWSSPVVANGNVYVGIGEGENPFAYSFVYCLDGKTGNVVWIYCTCQYEQGKDNAPNVLPAGLVQQPPPKGFSLYTGDPVALGASVWSCIAYDADLNRLYCATGNPQPDLGLPEAGQPGQGYSYGLLALDASSGDFKAFYQATADTNYRPSDIDVDFGGSPTIFTNNSRQKVVGLGCKNGTYFVLDADTLDLVNKRQLLPHYNDGGQIPTVDPHSDSSEPNPRLTNEQSNSTPGENLFGTYSTAAVHTKLGRLFLGIGGNNYHPTAPGIDYATTPFMRVFDWNTLEDAWALDTGNPPKYSKPVPPMYTNPGESGLSSPAVVNDVVFCSTSKIAVYAFDAEDGTLLWNDQLGAQTGGYSGGYGYCLGPAVWGNYVVAGGLIFGRKGGILRIYGLASE